MGMAAKGNGDEGDNGGMGGLYSSSRSVLQAMYNPFT
jgi:hypothetical protein